MRRYFRPCFTTEELWCQLFSEPGSGSDLAGLGTRAARDGDDWIVNGQKVWTSLAHRASVGLLLARTHPDLPKHKGLTVFIVDMRTPGVEVRPLRQMTGDAEFNEVFLTDVRIPDHRRVGHAGDGWRVATTTLMNERVVIANAGSGRTGLGGSGVEKLLAVAKAGAVEPQLRDELVLRLIDGQVIRWTNMRARAARRAGTPGPEGSITKLSFGLHNRRLQETALRVQGLSSIAWEPGDDQAPELVRGFLRAQANTIEGGTANVLRNIIGEKVLGLPREPGPPSSTPWSQLPRNGIARLGQQDP
jgi:alkylation response protein AidB-like acyl-CoA dehydrogenase